MPRLIKTRVEIEGRVEEEIVVVDEHDEAIRPWGREAELHVVGQPTPRIDGAARVTGGARFTYDIQLPGMLHARVLRSPHPHARVRAIDVSAASALPGVFAVMSHEQAPAIPWFGHSQLFDPTLRYVGDEVAVVAASDPDIAADALELIRVEYELLPCVLDPHAALAADAPRVHPAGNLVEEVAERGDLAAGFAAAEVEVAGSFRTGTAMHNSLETHGVVASWEGDQLTLYHSTQDVFETRTRMAVALGLAEHKIRVIKHYMGGGFGSKIGTGKYAAMAAVLARRTGRPVQLMLTREEENVAAGNRPATSFEVRLGARRDGQLTAIAVTTTAAIGAYGSWAGGGTGPFKTYYACPHLRAVERGVRVNLGTMSAFRAPGFVEGSFALESLIDELAAQLGLDPLELRRRNYAERDPENDRPFSSKGLLAAYERGAELAGWATRDQLRSTGRLRRGMGMSTQVWWGSGGPPAYAWAKLNGDATVTVMSGTQDIGTGVKSALAQIAAEELGLTVADIAVELGDTQLTPRSSLSAGSMTLASAGPAVRGAAADLKRQIFALAADLLAADPAYLTLEAGTIYVLPRMDRRMTLREFGQKLGDAQLTGKGARLPNPQEVSIQTFGAQFAEVEVDTHTGQVRVLRVVAVHDSGRIINPMAVESQINGGIIQGMGFALFEERIVDQASGVVLNPNLEGYKLPTMADVPPLDHEMLDLPDASINTIGAKGVGEPPIIPTAAAIANAVYHATGVRVRELPLTPARMLAALRQREAADA